ASGELLRDYNVIISIRHYGDTKNLPYGEKSPEQIAALASAGVLKALADGADLVFIACNTASTQYDAIQRAVENAYPGRSQDVLSIIDASALRAKEIIDRKLASSDEARFAVLATPATVRNMAYPRRIAALYQTELVEQKPALYPQERWYRAPSKAQSATVESLTQESRLRLANGKTVHLVQLAPANWVDLIEHGGNLADKNRAVTRDLNLLFAQFPDGAQLDGFGYFCTHYPVLDNAIRLETTNQHRAGAAMDYIAQGALMAELFRQRAQQRLKDHRRTHPPDAAERARLSAHSRASITLSSDHIEATHRLARTMFPGDPEPTIIHEDFSTELRARKQAR
ncbi:MAG: aspartate/glutamate racemase family protein, partial [Nevskiales bacterium]